MSNSAPCDLSPSSSAASVCTLERSPRADPKRHNKRLAKQNGELVSEFFYADLHPLCNPKNGKAICWFPANLLELRKLGVNSLNQILCSLHVDFDLNADRVAKVGLVASLWVKFEI
ncbi:hypothetical protein QQS21_004078 [Conoideocrella luteorostrata]|uniref:Uncharacterized protein n=1 Tax=Conoideocrella luteorostrata TaxID=1105319 RepID=A0AAJ0G024_9HYPO|nr:hypothetical protein QQS21_004078 [Conoideocrella luteorostrata]